MSARCHYPDMAPDYGFIEVNMAQWPALAFRHFPLAWQSRLDEFLQPFEIDEADRDSPCVLASLHQAGDKPNLELPNERRACRETHVVEVAS
jgi:hypothetical protein